MLANQSSEVRIHWREMLDEAQFVRPSFLARRSDMFVILSSKSILRLLKNVPITCVGERLDNGKIRFTMPDFDPTISAEHTDNFQALNLLAVQVMETAERWYEGTQKGDAHFDRQEKFPLLMKILSLERPMDLARIMKVEWVSTDN
ncbi:MAG: hypothetical protein IJ083_17515 [Clostridia bacterium]|nr:hypothetical protein [Clostridia bacterium]